MTIDNIGGDVVVANVQTIAVDAHEVNRASIPPEVRLQNIHEVAEEVHQRLDRFEVAHAHFLKIGRAHKFTDAFALLEDDASGIHRELVNASFERLGLGLASVAAASDVKVSATANANVNANANANANVIVDAASNVMHVKHNISVKALQEKNLAERAHGWRDALLRRRRAIVYVRLVVATLAIAFAAPIETRSLWRRAVTGPLVLVPIAMPDSDMRQYANESDLPSLHEEQALR
jgi:hypothetical protein